MKFKVYGAYRDTGQEVELIFNASDRQEAIQWVDRAGIAWRSIRPHTTAAQAIHLASTLDERSENRVGVA